MKENGHYYTPSGEPMHWVAKKTGPGTRPTTIADAKKLGLFPSVTQILRILDKPALTTWLIDQAVNAVLTAPRLPGEELDAFKTRVLVTESQQDQESQQAKDRGTAIHEGLAEFLQGKPVAPDLLPFIEPVATDIHKIGMVFKVEHVLVGPGYAGRCDLILQVEDGYEIVDFKTTKKLPKKEAWPEHRLQCAAYAKCPLDLPVVRTSNIYISSIEPGQFVYLPHVEPWRDTYEHGFLPVFKAWCWMNNYYPNNFYQK